MIIDPATTLNMPGITSQSDLQGNSGPAVGNQANNSPTASNQATSTAKNNPLSNQNQDMGKANASSNLEPTGIVGGLALDDHNGVVVRFYDATGKVVAQYPPEDYIEMMKELKQVTKNLFHITV
ncbi:MAG: hypothetical protein ACLQF0_06955 [Dissulfurispiraceae bacterium]